MRRYHHRHAVTVLAAIWLLTLPAASPATGQVIATVENLGNTLVFHPTLEFTRLVLSVTGPCDFLYRQVVLSGDQPSFQLDSTTIDGAYTFHLMREEAIDPGVVAMLQEARAAFDDETPKQLCRQGKLPGPPLDLSGGFQVVSGEILFDPDTIEQPPADETLSAGAPAPTNRTFDINDNLFVDGSACIGFDCDDPISFGFATVLLREHNLRIKFDDTSTAASFPRNDWQLVANDSANGGASKFSIQDVSGNRTPFTVEANARSHALYVDDGGRIGSRTSTPAVELHTIDGDTPTLRLQQDGSSGFAPQTWDVAGNETNFFVRDVTNGSALPFRVRPGAPSNSIFVDAEGNVGLGTTTPAAKLEVKTGSVIVDGGFQAGSSRTIKSGFEPIDRQALLDSLRELPIESWSYRQGDDDSRHLGPVAEEFHAAFGLGRSDQHIDLGDSAGVSLAALQGVLELLAEKDRQLARLRGRLDALERAVGSRAFAAAPAEGGL